jgi:hypothetical protein
LHGVGVGLAQRKAAFGHGAAALDVVVLGQRPAVVVEIPPVVAIMLRVAPAEIDAGLVVIGHAGKANRPNAPIGSDITMASRGQARYVSAPRQRRRKLALDRERQRLDMARSRSLPFCATSSRASAAFFRATSPC